LLAGGPAGSALADHVDHEREDEWHITHTVNATVVDNYATVRVGVEIVNEGPDPEFPFRVDLPEDAYVTGLTLTLTRDGTTHEATIEKRDQARQRYEDARREHRSAGLVEQQRDAPRYTYNVNVEGTETVRAVLPYERYLTAEAGSYQLDLTAPATNVGVDEGAQISARIEYTAGLANSTPPTPASTAPRTARSSRRTSAPAAKKTRPRSPWPTNSTTPTPAASSSPPFTRAPATSPTRSAPTPIASASRSTSPSSSTARARCAATRSNGSSKPPADWSPTSTAPTAST